MRSWKCLSDVSGSFTDVKKHSAEKLHREFILNTPCLTRLKLFSVKNLQSVLSKQTTLHLLCLLGKSDCNLSHFPQMNRGKVCVFVCACCPCTWGIYSALKSEIDLMVIGILFVLFVCNGLCVFSSPSWNNWGKRNSAGEKKKKKSILYLITAPVR